MTIPETVEKFYTNRSKKHRKHLRQYQNKLNRKYSDQIKFYTFSKPEEVFQAIKDATAVSKSTYQFALGVGVEDSPVKHSLLQTAAEKGWFRGHILYINNEPVAFRFVLKYGKVYHGDGTGYDQKWKSFRVGTILFIKVLEQLCVENNVDYYDFGFGDAQYKKSYGDECWHEATAMYLFAPRMYPVFINLVCTVTTAANVFLKYILTKSGMLNKVKRKWRDFLQKNKTR